MQYKPYARRPGALQDNLLRVQNDQLYDVPGRSQSPYQTNVLFAAAPARLDAPTNSVSFVFRRNLFLSGNGRLPTSLALDFGDGNGYRIARWGRSLSTVYAAGGSKRIKVRIEFVSSPPREEGASAHVNVRYGAGHTSLVKPLIVVEQYNIATVANGKLAHCNNSNNIVDEFLDRTEQPFTAPFNLNGSLEQAGYDIVYIDFDYNTDYIERNAALFENVVRLVNGTWKQPFNGVM